MTCAPGRCAALARGILAALAALGSVAVWADEGAPPDAARLLKRLGSPRYDVRQRASAELRASGLPTSTWRAVLHNPDLPLEVHLRVGELAAPTASEAALPAARNESLVESAVEWAIAVDRAAAWLQTEVPSREAAARRQLAELLGQPEAIGPLLGALARHLARADLAPGARRALEVAYERALREAVWADPARLSLPAASAAQLRDWCETWLGDSARSSNGVQKQAAERALRLALLRDDQVPRVAEAVRWWLAHCAGAAAEGRAEAEELLEWTQPCLAAEAWDGELASVQYLIIGQPQHPAGAPKVTLFDRADHRTARCVTGNSLLPGEYPVGQAFPHPQFASVFFHLSYLPTPRDRMRFNRTLEEQSESERRRWITQHTLRRWTAERRSPTEKEVVMLFDALDGVELSQEVGEYLAAVEDRAGSDMSLYGFPYCASSHARICFRLARQGKRGAVPGLVKAIERGNIAAPTADGNPYHYGWIAALAIAARDPWPGVDEWLASLVHRNERLFVPTTEEQPEVPTLGATAAGLLAERYGWPPGHLGLIRVELDHLNNAGCPGYRFAGPWGCELCRQQFRP